MDLTNLPPVNGTFPSKLKVEVKEEPQPTASYGTDVELIRVSKVKKEEPDNVKVDISLPEGSRYGNDMFEDVDGPEIVDLTYEGIAEINGVDHFVCEDFKIPQIPKPKIVTRPLQSLFNNIESSHIILDPDYQREVVWDEGRASLLITSILMGYFIPPIIFNVKCEIFERDGQKKEKYTRICVDGKQRLTSIHKFMTGMIGFFDSNSPQKKWYFCHPVYHGRESYSNHNILPKAVKDFFISQSFCCYEYTDMKLETEETMFQLVQRGVALTPAEKMRAMSTEWATFTKQYEDDYTLIVNLSKQSRASGFRLVLTIFTMIQEVMSGKRNSRSSAPTLQASPQALLKVLEDKDPIPDALKLKFKAIFDRYENLVKISSAQITATRFNVKENSVFDPAPEFLRVPGVEHVRTFSPLELIATAIVVSRHMEHRTDQELLEDVKTMRYYLRMKHKDLRVNAQCWSTVWEFVEEEMARRRAAGVTEGLGSINNIPMPLQNSLIMQPAGVTPHASLNGSTGAGASDTVPGGKTPAQNRNARSPTAVNGAQGRLGKKDASTSPLKSTAAGMDEALPSRPATQTAGSIVSSLTRDEEENISIPKRRTRSSKVTSPKAAASKRSMVSSTSSLRKKTKRGL